MKKIIPFEGKPVWIGSDNVEMLLLPITGKPTQAELSSMALAMDEDSDGNCTFFLRKMTKEALLRTTKHEFDCKHDLILARMVIKDGEEFSAIVPPDDGDRLKIFLTLVPKGTAGPNLPVHWLNDKKQEKN